MNDVSQLFSYQLMASALVIVGAFVLSGIARRRAPISPQGMRIVVVALGMVANALPQVLRAGNITDLKAADLAVDGFAWLVFYEISRVTKSWFGSRTTIRWVVLLGLIWVMEGVVGGASYFVYALATGQATLGLQGLPEMVLSWFQALARYPYNLLNLADAATFMVVSYCFGRETGFRVRSSSHFWKTGGFGSLGGLDMETSASKSQSTRLLCASAFLEGSSFREMVLGYLNDLNRASAPELGVDLGLVARVCKFAHNRDRRYEWVFGGCFLLAVIGALVDPSIGIAVLVLASGGVYLRKSWQDHITFPKLFARHAFDPEGSGQRFQAELEPEQMATLPSENQNLIVYRGFSPFVGAGINLGGWSFVVNVDKGKEETGEELHPIKFQSSELYTELDRSLGSLGLSGLTQQDMYFISGSDLRDDRVLLPNIHGRPVQTVDAEDGAKYQASNDRRIRHYKWIRVMDWGNELSTSYFLRCTLRGSNLFVEISRYLLTPLATQYRRVDAMAEGNWQKGVALTIGAALVGPFKTLVSPLVLFARFQEHVGEMFDRKQKERDRLIDENPLFDYGVGRSLRESLSSDQFLHYFQKLDGDFYSKVLEREILATIVSFLDEHDIDTSELKERQSTILNSGIIVHGGDVKAESLAVGTGAQAVQMSKSEPARKLKLRRPEKGAA